LSWKVGDLDGEFGADEKEEVEKAGPGERGVTTRKRFEGVVHKMRIWIFANVGGNERPSWIQILAAR
jgi:hypothetical protein